MEQPQTERLTKKRRRKLRVGRVIFTMGLFMFIGVGVYSIIQFKAGQKLAISAEGIEEGAFLGDAVNFQDVAVENYLLLGMDNDGSGRSRTDTMMVLSWNRQAGEMKLISFMRDIYAEIPGYQSYKLNTAYYLGGVQTAKDTLTGMFGIPIHHYAVVDFSNFESLVDLAFPNGVSVQVEKDMSEKIGVDLSKGEQQLTGKELLGYARFRADEEGDFGRVRRQQQVIQALKKQAIKPEAWLKVPKVAGAFTAYIHTDLEARDMLSRGYTALSKGKDLEIQTLTIPAEDTYTYEFYQHAGSVIEIDLEKNRQIISEFIEMPLVE